MYAAVFQKIRDHSKMTKVSKSRSRSKSKLRPRILRREKREDEDRNWREGVLSVLSQDDRSETVVALVLGARRRKGGKSQAFLRQENPSEIALVLVQEGGSVLVDGKLGSGWALWPRPCCSPSLSHKSVAVLWFSSWVLKCCGFPQECCSALGFGSCSVVLVQLALDVVLQCCLLCCCVVVLHYHVCFAALCN